MLTTALLRVGVRVRVVRARVRDADQLGDTARYDLVDEAELLELTAKPRLRVGARC